MVAMIHDGCFSIANHTKNVFEEILKTIAKDDNDVARNGPDKATAREMADMINTTVIDMRLKP